MNEKMEFGKNLKSELKYQDIREKELAYKTGISLNTLRNYINKKKCMPPADTALKIARALNVTVEYLLIGGKN